MSFVLRISALCLAIGCMMAADPAKATVIIGDKETKALVQSEDLDGLVWSDESGRITSTSKPGQYRVIYDDVADTNWYRGQAHYEAGRFAEAGANFALAANSLRVDHAAIQSCLMAAECFLRAREYGKGLEILNRHDRVWPKSIYLGKSAGLRGAIQAASGDQAAAKATYEALVKREREWGIESTLVAVRGLADLARSASQPAEALSLAAPLLARVKPEAAPQAWAQLAVDHGRDLAKAGKTQEALAIWNRLVNETGDSNAQAAGRLDLARHLASRPDKESQLSAVDQYAIIVALPGIEGAVVGPARREGRALCEKLSKDLAVTPEEQREYRLLSNKF